MKGKESRVRSPTVREGERALAYARASDTMTTNVSKAIDFKVESREGEARAGVLTTRRGVIETPVFMPVGTAGTVKGIRFEELESTELDARIILGNTYHLWLRPGIETIRACRGLHKVIRRGREKVK